MSRAEPATAWICAAMAKKLVTVASSRAAMFGQYVGRTGWMDLFERSVVVLVPGVVVGEEFIARGMVRRNQLGVLPGGFDIPEFKSDPAADWMRGVPTLATVSRVNWTKGQARIIKAWRKVLEVVPEARFVVAGPDETNGAMRALAEREGVAGSVVFTGSLVGPALWSVYRNATATALLTSVDAGGPPLSVTESMALGTPVIVLDDPQGCSESVRGVAVIVDGENIADVSGAIVSLLTDAEMAARYRASGEQFARSKTWKALATKLEGWITNGSTD